MLNFIMLHVKFILTAIQIIYFFYPETKRRSLEDMDLLFDESRSSHPNFEQADSQSIEAEDEVIRPKSNAVWVSRDAHNQHNRPKFVIMII